MRHLLVPALLLLLVACGGKGATTNEPPDAGTIMTPTVPDAGCCSTGEDAGTNEADAGTAQVTWHKDIVPIVQTSCLGCHATGGIGPFSLETYGEAFTHHAAIADAVVARRMPPWKADDSCVDLKDSRALPQAQIDLIAEWSANGAPEGDPNDAPPPPDAKPGLGWVDVTLDAQADYTPNTSVSDDYRCFMLPPAYSASKDIIGFEVLPGVATQVHHVIVFHVPLADAQAAEDADPGLGWTCYGGTGTNQQNARMIGGWVPGNGATPLPEGTGIRVPANDVIVMQVHYNLAAGAQPDRTKVRLQYAKTPVAKTAVIFPILENTFSIPPNSMGHTTKGTFTLPTLLQQATLYGVTPHMHQLGRKIRVRNASTDQCLVNVPEWDFHWQQSYEYATPITVSGGQSFEIECTWDNPGAQSVTWGEGTADEMCLAFFYATIP